MFNPDFELSVSVADAGGFFGSLTRPVQANRHPEMLHIIKMRGFFLHFFNWVLGIFVNFSFFTIISSYFQHFNKKLDLNFRTGIKLMINIGVFHFSN